MHIDQISSVTSTVWHPFSLRGRLTLKRLFFVAALFSFSSTVPAVDTDSDGVDDAQDNCIEIANSDQLDTNADGFGNRCDADLDDNGFVNFADLGRFKSAFGTSDANADFDGSGFVNFADLGIFKALFGKPPGPAGSGGSLTQTEAARFLAQSTFGPKTADIDHLTGLGNFDNWLNEQFSLPASSHLPLVKARAPNGRDTQRARYPVWWQLALHANDQLRQRVAFALSEIMVVSDKPDALINHGNMLATYYDVLVQHAFGNFRTLLEEVTLNPAMGIYLSMLGNESVNGRADENYAREIMQLFSIGLVQLNQDGTAVLDGNGKPVPTYQQTDVANLAKVFTGWSWDTPDFDGNPIDGWYPDLTRMEKPMKAFTSHHDSAAKTFLGTTLPAGQTPGQDLDAALDVIFNHNNVGPFIGKQLIQRIVTSNPSPAYVTRVAAAFNNNGQGERGDMKAVIRAVLLDPEVRSQSSAQDPEFGKLREPILRFSHLWRAFDVQDPIEMDHFGGLMSQHAPLTAKSVFNFFSPFYSPQGPLKDSGLVAPEFQIDSEAWVNAINSLLINIVQFDSFYSFFETRLNLTATLALLDTPDRMLDYLDVLLMSGGLSSGFRQLLLDYITQNRSTLGDERVVRDVVSLIITSAEYWIQR
jgi:uncharacterized protein (DUF1800 family)